MKYIIVLTTAGRKRDAEKIAKVLVEKKLAACVQIIGPITSTYAWKDKIETAHEWLCIIKTKKALYKKVEAAVKSIHSYETPEIITVALAAGSREYLKWLDAELEK